MEEASVVGVGEAVESLDNLRAMKVVGKGATGTVILVHVDQSHNYPHDDVDNSNSPPSRRFALKIIPKTTSSSSAQARALSELSILTRLSTTQHPCLPKLLGYFEESTINNNNNQHVIMGYATNYCSGGDLNSLIRLNNNNGEQTLSDNVIKFYLSEVVCALQHLHSMGIVYRDLKPENILIQDNGHLLLTDFDLSSTNINYSSSPDPPSTTTRRPPNKNKWMWSRSRVSPVSKRRWSRVEGQRCNYYTFVGTEEYVSPEMVGGGPHGFGVDWWAVGVLAYEMLYGTTPFKGRNKKETFLNILMKRPVFFGRSTPLTLLIRRLLEKEPSKRLGYADIIRHQFFQGVNWEMLTQVSRPPFIPSPEEDELLGDGVGLREYFTKLALLPGPSSPIN